MKRLLPDVTVVLPLSEIAPKLLLPGQQKTVAQLLAALANKEITVQMNPS